MSRTRTGGPCAGAARAGKSRSAAPHPGARLRARSVDGHELARPSFTYAAGRAPLDARTLEAIAIGVTTRQYHRALDPLPTGTRERAVSKSSVSRRFVARTSAQLTTWLSRPLDDLDLRIIFLDGLHCRDHVVLLALGVESHGQKHVLGLREGTTENATVCKSLPADLHARGLALERAVLLVIDGGTGLRKAIRETCGPTAVVQRAGHPPTRSDRRLWPRSYRKTIR